MPRLRVTDVTVEHIEAATDAVLATLAQMADADVTGPSLCTGWTRGHVTSHLARNADGLARVLRSGLDGTGETMYDSVQRRDGDIDDGADRTADALRTDVRDSARDLHALLLRLRPEYGDRVVPRVPGGFEIPLRRVPFMRLRELVYHHVDLAWGYSFRDLEPDVAALMLDQQMRTLAAGDAPPAMRIRTDEGETYELGRNGPAVTGSRAAVLLWLGRSDPGDLSFSGPVPELPFGG